MGWQPGPGEGADADRRVGVPGGDMPARDPRLAAFAPAGGRYVPVPSGALALLADHVSGPGRDCPGATDGQLAGLLKAWAAIESWAAAGKLGVIAEMIRRDQAPPGAGRGEGAEGWSASLRHELAAALACSAQSADTTAWLAREQQERLPGTGALLGDGTLTYGKARAVTETFRYLSDADAAAAEAMIAGLVAGKTYPQVLRLAEQAALTVDPELAARRREQAQKRDARVMLFREQQGTAGLSGRDLPPDEALAAMASVNARAQEYEDCGALGDTAMDVLRACAYLDLLNGVAPEARIAAAAPHDEAADAADALAWAQSRAARTTRADGGQDTQTGTAAGTGTAGAADPGTAGRQAHGGNVRDPAGHGTPNRTGDDDDNDEPGEGDPGDDGPGGAGPGGPGPGGAGPGGAATGPGTSPATRALQARPPDLTVPLATLLGLAERPGEIQRLGPVDPALARQLAAAAAASPHTTVCITVTSPEGHAIGHGCARPARKSRAPRPADTPSRSAATAPGALPARLNLTIPATTLTALTSHTCHSGPWTLTPPDGPGPPRQTRPPHGTSPPNGPRPPDQHDQPGGTGPPGTTPPPGTAHPGGYGTWTLTVPGGRQLTLRLDPVPTYDCDHRHETPAYQPGDKLRHLVQVRDGTCTFPTCNHHARDSDFEHAQPYHQGGRTCACNAGARSRACHRVKQAPGWTVTQPKPGWHQWQTPAGYTYVQEPWRYPA